MNSVLVGMIDSGVSNSVTDRVKASCAFHGKGSHSIESQAALPDQLGHGTAVAEIILQQSQAVELLNAQIFLHKLVGTPVQAAAALNWLIDQGAQIVNMSFGLSHDREVLRTACRAAHAAGAILVAAAPARGNLVYPAGYETVIRATGDARCAPGQISHLNSAQADFGGHVNAGSKALQGASMGCAHVTAVIAACLAEQVTTAASCYHAVAVIDWLVEHASFKGVEKHLV